MAPASDDRKARKALASIADEVVLDLEDAVTPANKDSARTAAAELVAEFGADRAVSLRINAIDTPWASDDLAACAQMPNLTSVVLPKADTPGDLREADKQLGDSSVRLQALLETPRGIRDAPAICAATDRLDAVLIGYADLGASLGRASGLPMQTWHVVQDSVLLAARAAGVDVVDGPHLTIADDDTFRDAKRWVRDLGFDGTWVIHPAQLASAIEIFTPDTDAVEDARRVLDALEKAAAAGAGAAELDGRMLDEALAVSARRVLAKAAVDD
ncbi:HpcH/HpaI aldolase/citrate lyase family protein [Gordonia rubripertincta]|uniref:HpcH/HpaI aldolase/citrate lyase family protein n=1 Tax=Gordonia rubripertincta TaxID=36822 RepID=UPI0015FD2542|nr:CoA ester lyase [Gordonia rubripertincta]QMU21299.1 CoA ester lyase [Gordonia rubripertincta]